MAQCHDEEGFAFVSRLRDFDVTLCFEEGILLSSPLAVLLACSVLSSLSLCIIDSQKRSTKSRVILGGKLTLLILALACSLSNVFLVLIRFKQDVPILQSYILEPLALGASLFLTYYHHTRHRMSSSVLLVFWPLYATALIIWARSVVLKDFEHYRLLLLLKGGVGLFGVASFALECVGPEVGLPEDGKSAHESPLLTANIFSRWSFGWMTPLLAKGASKFISEDDLPSLVPSDESEVLGNRLQRYLTKHGVWKSLFLAYGGPYMTATFLKLVQDILAFMQPQLLRLLLAYISRYQGSRYDTGGFNPLEGFSIGVIMLVASVTQTVLLNQYFQRTFETGMRVRAGLVTAIFSKAMALSNDERGRSTGDIVNLMSVDAIRMQDLCTYAIIAISGPFQIILAFISLYNLLGWACFVGVAVMILSMPLNTVLARILKRMQEQQMKNRDERTRLMSELLSTIKSIKLYAWESAFIRKILAVRNDKELRMLRKIGLLNSFSSALWSGIPLLVAFSSLATAAWTSPKPITSDVIFPAISLFMLLQFPLAMFSQVISNIIEALVSVKRLSHFFQASELQPDAREIIHKPNLELGDEVLNIKDADFRWDSKDLVPTLENINLIVRKGELTAVMGRVGAGKTSLLSAIIGDMSRSEGRVKLFGSVSYAPQNPWIMSATVRDNITFNHVHDEDFYARVIEACALGPDIALLPQGDLTEVGEKGITLSGGQRARISLARAVYARADLVLLDDCLAAVDSHVARHVFDRVIGPHGLLACQARVLVTNSIAFVSQFQQIVYIRRGIIGECGSYQALMQNPESDLCKLVRGHSTSSSSGSSTPFVTSGTATPIEDSANIGDDKSPDGAAMLSEKLRHRTSFPKAVFAPPKPVRAANSAGLSQEHRETGRVKQRVYLEYIAAASKSGFVIYLFCAASQQVAGLLGNLTLRAWGEHNALMGDNSGMLKYLLIYGLFSLGSTVLGGISNVIMWVYCSLRSSKRLHDSMLTSLMNAPLGFFELTPTGRTLNLFSRDMYVVDQLLARFVQNMIRTMLVCLSIFVVIGASFPLFLISVIPLGWFYLRVMKYYLSTSRELKRLDAVSKSPIFAWFSESLAGVSTIRSFSQQAIFILANQRHIDRNQICYLPSISINRWLSVRLEIVGALIIFMVVILANVALITTTVDAGLVGLVLAYAMNATSSLNWAVRSTSDVEQNIVSVERILHQIDVPPERPQHVPEAKPDDSWPAEGRIAFQNYSTRYRPELDLVLNRISVEITPKMKLGICGRTGAGKSSLLLALFRIIEGTEGAIFIDGVDISKIGLHDLRSSISIVPQMPDLFEGTLRENIDPIGRYDDVDIWAALGQAHLKEYVESLPQGLDTPVREGGQSLSAGQKQLICFARALLRKSKILVLDEATSAVDLDTDKAIQEIIQGPAFSGVTILTIAHRLNTIIGGSSILVMDQGKVAELDTPQNLLANRSSIFYSLATEAGLT
ncbi:multidrug resistance-associated ABC transporter [Mycena pura]|uniref:Multidrug resistance-associated ABC transporter n=1 Tax=Mycena pura TaxID=153505 RepID=A0AAD7E261_9AGAR|nr:multidrug resistance-associated ABC transporter [Mycena pura]